VELKGIKREDIESRPLNTAGRSCEATLDNFVVETEGLEDLRSLVRL
jgi:hypothetical protein